MRNPRLTDMTVGSPVKHILSLAWPLLVGNLFQQLYNMVDSIVVGNFVGSSALAAVGACGSMNFFFFSLSLGLAIGIGIIVSQYFGAKDEKNVKVTIANSFFVLGIAALATSIVGIVFCPQILRLMATPESIIEDSILYMRITCTGLIAVAIYNGIAIILRALGDSKTPLYFLVFASIINVALDILFVVSFSWGVFGVAIATVISQVCATIISFIYAYRKIPYFHLSCNQLRPNKAIIAKSFKLGIPIALQNSMIAVSCMALQGIVNTFGEVAITAFTITNRIEQIVQQPYGSLAMAVTSYSGQNIGAGKIDRVRKGFYRATAMAAIFSISMIPIAYIFGRSIVGTFVESTEIEVIEMGAIALRITSLCYFALGMIYVPRAVLNGCGDTTFAMLNGITEVICRVAFSQLLIRIPVIGYWGIWGTNGCTWLVTSIVCVIRYGTGKWKTKSIVKS